MSYSRWSTSFWYTYRTDEGTDAKEDQHFQICDVTRSQSFSYPELKKDIDECLDRVKVEWMQEKEHKLLSNTVRDEKGRLKFEYNDITVKPVILEQHLLDELKGYMLQFIEACEEDDLIRLAAHPRESCVAYQEGMIGCPECYDEELPIVPYDELIAAIKHECFGESWDWNEDRMRARLKEILELFISEAKL